MILDIYRLGYFKLGNLGFDSLPTLPRRQAGGQAGAQHPVTLQPATQKNYNESFSN